MSEPAPSRSAAPGVGILLFCLLLLIAAGLGLQSSVSSRTPAASDHVPFSVHEVRDVTLGKLRPVYQLGKHVSVGGTPLETAALEALSRRGVRTLISVEALAPDVEAAREHGLAVVHLPMTFREVAPEVQLQLARVALEQAGPFYVCCDDSRQRGPVAAVMLWRCLDAQISPEQAVATLRKLGSTGNPALAASVREFVVPRAEELQSTAELPHTSHVPPLAKTMAEMGRLWQQLQQEDSTPSSVTVSVRLATLDELLEKCREAGQLADVPAEMQPRFQDLEQALESLADSIKQELRTSAGHLSPRDVPLVQDRCDRCHAQFRN